MQSARLINYTKMKLFTVDNFSKGLFLGVKANTCLAVCLIKNLNKSLLCELVAKKQSCYFLNLLRIKQTNFFQCYPNYSIFLAEIWVIHLQEKLFVLS
jgi:hypothetical protein